MRHWICSFSAVTGVAAEGAGLSFSMTNEGTAAGAEAEAEAAEAGAEAGAEAAAEAAGRAGKSAEAALSVAWKAKVKSESSVTLPTSTTIDDGAAQQQEHSMLESTMHETTPTKQQTNALRLDYTTNTDLVE